VICVSVCHSARIARKPHFLFVFVFSLFSFLVFLVIFQFMHSAVNYAVFSAFEHTINISLSYLSCRMAELHQISVLVAYGRGSGPPVVTLRYVLYFWFCR